MDPEHRRRIEDLCDAALDRDPDERAAFVAAACGGEDALREEVEALLAHAPEAERFLTTPLGEVAAQILADGHGGSLVGRQIGSHKILSLLGAGGMGEVYRARDTKLGRDVAIKVVSDAFLSIPERLARFEREARVLAALNHPHIGAIYGLEEADGVRGLVLELVEGPTLAERLAAGPLPIQEALADRAPDRRRARSGAREGHHPPRSETGQHQDHTRRHGEGARLRPGEGVCDGGLGNRRARRRPRCQSSRHEKA